MTGVEERRAAAGEVTYRVRLRRGGRAVNGTFDTAAEAVAFRAAALAAIATGAALPEPPVRQEPPTPSVVPTGPLTLAQAAHELVEGMMSGGVRTNRGHPYKPATWRETERRLRLHVIHRVGAIPVVALRRGDVRRMVDQITAASGPTVAALARDALRLVLRLQVEREVIEQNVAHGVRAPAFDLRPARFLTPQEADRLQAAADADRRADVGPFVALALATGLRDSEMRGLWWGPEGLDLASRVVHVRRARDRGGELVETKSRRPRDVPVGADTAARMREWRMASGRPVDGALVFRARLVGAWPRVRAAAGLAPPLPRLHDLRHTAATHWLAAGLKSHAVAELLGHTDAGLVDRLYGHALPDEVACAGEVLEAWRTARRGA